MNNYYEQLNEADQNGTGRAVVADRIIAELEQEIAHLNKEYNLAQDALNACFIHNQKMKAYDEIAFLKRHREVVHSDTKITEAHILRAREYPIHELIEFKNGKAEAWCHADKNPSLSWWREKNKAYCFVCCEAFDSIDVVMHQHNLTFHEAVRFLQ